MTVVPVLVLNFVSGGVLWGLAAVSVPVVVHLLFRRQPVVVRFPAIRFILASQRQTARRFRLKQLLLMLLRMVLIAAFVVVLAGPRLVERHGGLGGATRRVNAVVILDTSYSMGHEDPDGSTRFHRAKALALQMLELFSDDSRLALILCADQPRLAVGAFTFDRVGITEKIKRSRRSARATDCVAAISAAHRLFRERPALDARAIFLFTDCTANGWRALNAAEDPLATSTPVYIIDVGSEASDNRNVALVRDGLGPASVRLPMQVQAQVTVPPETGSATIELSVDGQVRDDRPLAAGTPSCTLRFTPQRPGYLAGHVGLRGRDPLPIDDRAYFAVPCSARQEVVVVDGTPTRSDKQSAAFFLTTALAPPTSEFPPPFRCRILAPGAVSAAALEAAQAVVLVDVARLAAEEWRAVADHVAGGGALVVFGGPQVDAASYNRHGRDPLDPHGGLLPCVFEAVHTDLSGFRFRLGRFAHPLLRAFETENPHLGKPLFLACSRVKPIPDDSAVILAFANGLPALLEKRYGAGRVLVFTAGAGLRWGRLPVVAEAFPRVASGAAYVPFVQELLRYATQVGDLPPWHAIGAPVRLDAPAGQRLVAARVQPPDQGTWTSIALPRDAQGRLPAFATLPSTEQPGIYLVELTTGKTTLARLLAVNVDPRESLPDRIAEKQLAELLPGITVRVFEGLEQLGNTLEVGGTTTDLNRYLIPLLLLLLLLELLLANHLYARTPAVGRIGDCRLPIASCSESDSPIGNRQSAIGNQRALRGRGRCGT